MNEYSCFFGISLQFSMLLWISIWIFLDFYGYPCIDLLWILYPGEGTPRSSYSKIVHITFFPLTTSMCSILKAQNENDLQKLFFTEEDKDL